jgi:ABC-type uncharacterized transport system ATPase subunit
VTPALELSDVRKRFGALVALDGASLTVGQGTIHALLGENGAGKTTLMRIAFGLVMPDEGSIRVCGVTLSGGNQQRLVLARELDGNPPLVVAVNPTRGLDVAATGEIQRRLRAASRTGTAILYHSADLDEVVDVSDRVVVVYDGHVREVARNRDAVGRAMLGAA